MPSYAKRRDANHNPIEDIFRQMLGDHVTDSSGWGGGAGDLYVSFGDFPGIFIEIKRDAKADYTAAQIRFQRTHPKAWLRCENGDQAIEICKRIRKQSRLLTDFALTQEIQKGLAL